MIHFLKEAPGKSMPLFKMLGLLETRFHCSVSVSEVNKLKDICSITEELGGRMISLTQSARTSPPSNFERVSAKTGKKYIYCFIFGEKSFQIFRGFFCCSLNDSSMFYFFDIMTKFYMYFSQKYYLLTQNVFFCVFYKLVFRSPTSFIA